LQGKRIKIFFYKLQFGNYRIENLILKFFSTETQSAQNYTLKYLGECIFSMRLP